MWSNWNPCRHLVGMKIGVVSVENIMKVPQGKKRKKIERELPYDQQSHFWVFI